MSSDTLTRDDLAGAADSEGTSPAAAPERGLLHYIGIALSIALLLSVVALAAVTIVVPKLAGAIPLTVLTNSMSPGLPPGTLIIVRPVDPATIEVGDVITYQIESGKPGVITHRVIGFEGGADERRFILQGDNNASPDVDAVRPVQVQGELWYAVPYLGWANNAVNGEARQYILPVVVGLLFAYTLWMVVSSVRDRVKKRREASENE
ncbi:MAG: signal peptidase I [Microbacteriaceae bacterium]